MSNEWTDAAFNMGSDARLAGKPCFPPQNYDPTARLFWIMGWRDVHTNWGKDAKWWIDSLPQVNLKG